jgi:hypothetical protein
VREPGSTRPVTFFFLVLPYGISSGFVSMTATNGWVHDRFGTAWMLHWEALASVAIALVVLWKINAA